MRLFLLCLALFACAAARSRKAVEPSALRGVTVGLPPVADKRSTPGIGCGQVSQNLAQRAHTMLVAAFDEAGAKESLSENAPWSVTVVLREAGMGLEHSHFRRTDKPVQQPPPGELSLDQPRQSLFNDGITRADVVLDATLARGGQVVWTGTVTGHADSAPCVEAIDKVREAMADAIDEVREHVIDRIRGP